MIYLNSYIGSFKTKLQTICIGEYYKYVNDYNKVTYYYHFISMSEDKIFYNYYNTNIRDELRRSTAYKDGFASNIKLILIDKEEFDKNAYIDTWDDAEALKKISVTPL